MLEYASRIADKNPMFSEGFAEAICHTPQGAYIFATDPIGSVKTHRPSPQALGLLQEDARRLQSEL